MFARPSQFPNVSPFREKPISHSKQHPCSKFDCIVDDLKVEIPRLVRALRSRPQLLARPPLTRLATLQKMQNVHQVWWLLPTLTILHRRGGNYGVMIINAFLFSATLCLLFRRTGVAGLQCAHGTGNDLLCVRHRGTCCLKSQDGEI